MVERVITCVHSLRERLDETLLAHRSNLPSKIFEAILKENRKKLADGAFFGVLKASEKAIVLPPWVALAVRPRPGVWE
ncbi:hypothetical protein GOBAR_DD24461 [Gossypium barbadense]|nr:hypothetical protein GOBAR_DD24461 [Gossypium barbadense]